MNLTVKRESVDLIMKLQVLFYLLSTSDHESVTKLMTFRTRLRSQPFINLPAVSFSSISISSYVESRRGQRILQFVLVSQLSNTPTFAEATSQRLVGSIKCQYVYRQAIVELDLCLWAQRRRSPSSSLHTKQRRAEKARVSLSVMFRP